MKPLKYFLCFIFYTSLISSAHAQKEAHHWFFSPRGYMDFNQSPPFTTMLPTRDGQFFASISDASGNLLFFTDGRSFFNSRYQIMENGEGRYGDSRSTQVSIIIPKPGCKNLYYNFITELGYTNSGFSDGGWTIHYSVVDVSAGNGTGKVLVKNKILTQNQDDGLAVFEGSDGESFWLVTARGNSNELSAFNITKGGIHHCPVVSTVESDSPGALHNIKASADGKHLVMVKLTHVGNALQVYGFNNATGTFYKKFELSYRHNYGNNYPFTFKRYPYYHEFSPDGNNLFILEDSVIARASDEANTYSTLYKLDLRSADNQSLFDTRVKIFEFPPTNHYTSGAGHMQLSPDGRILMESFDHYLPAINTPNSSDHFNFSQKAITFDSWPGIIPTFPAFFFKEQGYEAPADILCETVVCAGSPVTLNPEQINDNYTYEWTNSKTFEVFEGMNPVLSVPEGLSEADITYYSLKVTDKSGCHIFDVVKVITLPPPQYEITGSKSVCPGVKEVSYWIEDAEEGVSLVWNAEGGDIVYGQGKDSILVNWGTTNPNAVIKLTAQDNIYACKSFSEFPVKVFKQLDTEKPTGIDTLNCHDDFYYYSILPTNGSYYNWQIINGEILEGQGNHQIKVAWPVESERGYLWIEESVNTDLEICFGRSDTLMVINPKAKGNQHVDLQSVSAVLNQPNVIELNYRIKYPQFHEDFLIVSHREAADANAPWKKVTDLSPKANKVTFSEPLSDKVIYEYKIHGQSICGDVVESSIHHNIVLTEPAIDENLEIHLMWNNYFGWKSGVKTYELYRKLDSQADFLFLQFANDSANVRLKNLSDGLEHCFYIKAISNDHKDYFSLSNVICLTYDHPLVIPNVFTPNGDEINDHFEITNIELYPENKLTIFNRHGKIIYQENEYKNKWNAQSLPAGVYFYHLITYKNRKAFKGWVQVLR